MVGKFFKGPKLRDLNLNYKLFRLESFGHVMWMCSSCAWWFHKSFEHFCDQVHSNEMQWTSWSNMLWLWILRPLIPPCLMPMQIRYRLYRLGIKWCLVLLWRACHSERWTARMVIQSCALSIVHVASVQLCLHFQCASKQGIMAHFVQSQTWLPWLIEAQVQSHLHRSAECDCAAIAHIWELQDSFDTSLRVRTPKVWRRWCRLTWLFW